MAPHIWIPEPYNDGGHAAREADAAWAETRRIRRELNLMRALLGIPPPPPPAPPPVLICDVDGCYADAIVQASGATRCFSHLPE